jgi:type II secretory pathway pseudopilin PulG
MPLLIALAVIGLSGGIVIPVSAAAMGGAGMQRAAARR